MAYFHLLYYLFLLCIINGRRSISASAFMLSGFFPFGADRETGDSQLLDDNDDKQPLYFPDSQLFPFYGKKYQLLSVSIGTFISFFRAMQLRCR